MERLCSTNYSDKSRLEQPQNLTNLTSLTWVSLDLAS